MDDQQLINQLKNLKNIHPEQNWVVLTRTKFAETSTPSASIMDIFFFAVPRMAAVPALAAILAFIGGVSYLANSGEDGVFVASVRNKSLSMETKEEIRELSALISRDPHKSASNAVVFNEDAGRQESFKNALRNRIEAKIGIIKDLFAQLEDGDLAREISLNPRRLEENFKLADGEIGAQVKALLADAEAALAEGNLIDALDLVNAIDRLLN